MLKIIIITVIFSRNHQQRRMRLPSYFMLMWRRFVRRNFIGHHRWNGWESTNQLWQHISHMKPCICCFIVWCRSVLCWNDVLKIELYNRILMFRGVLTAPPPYLKQNLLKLIWIDHKSHLLSFKSAKNHGSAVNSHPCNTQIFLRLDPSPHSINNIHISCRTTNPVWQLWSRHTSGKQATYFFQFNSKM